MTAASWAERRARGEVCSSCSDPPVAGRARCAYHLERARQVDRAARDPSYVLPPPRPHLRRVACSVCAGPHKTRACKTDAARARVREAKKRDRQRREAERYDAGLCVQCEDPRDDKRRRCKACREYQNDQRRADEREMMEAA